MLNRSIYPLFFVQMVSLHQEKRAELERKNECAQKKD